MPTLVEPAVNKKNFDFVDTIRCLSMMGIVFEHVEVFTDINYASFYTSMLQVSVIQFFKFATIAFFLIAGFLINHKFTEYSPLQYLKNRLKTTIGPWIFWLNVLVILNILRLILISYFKHTGEVHLPSPFLNYLGNAYYTVIFTTSFWFILNFLICIAILLAFKRYIARISFGVLLGLTSFFYSINLYYGWIRTQHTTAMFGFVFFLWLGAYMNKHSDALFAFINRTSYVVLIGITVALFLLADLEIIYLKSIAIEDAYNTLRITNIFYSLAFFLILLKVGSIPFINRVFEPRKTTFGIYLLHQIIIQHSLALLMRPFFRGYLSSMTALEIIGFSFIRFVITYTITMLLVKCIVKSRFKWSVGA